MLEIDAARDGDAVACFSDVRTRKRQFGMKQYKTRSYDSDKSSRNESPVNVQDLDRKRPSNELDRKITEVILIHENMASDR